MKTQRQAFEKSALPSTSSSVFFLKIKRKHFALKSRGCVVPKVVSNIDIFQDIDTEVRNPVP